MIFKLFSPYRTISTKQELEEAALHFGALPFFTNNIKGFSVAEMAAPGVLFGDGEDGCWEWKGPVIQEKTTAYGKFFKRKAGFMSIELYPDFINYRRSAYRLQDDSLDEVILDIVNENGRLTSAEMRRIIFGVPKKRRRAGDLVDELEINPPKRQVLEPSLQRLQMSGRLLISDFRYKHSHHGERYGWGEAVYTIPELWFGIEVAKAEKSPEQSFFRLVDHLKSKLKFTRKSEIEKLLK